MELHAKKKVEIVTDVHAREQLAKLILDCGAKGYTLVKNVGGQGSRGVRESGDIFGVFENVMFIVVASEPIAKLVVERAMTALQNRPHMVLVSDVSVVRDDHF